MDKQDWVRLHEAIMPTFAMEFPHGCLVLVGRENASLTMAFVPDVHLGEQNGVVRLLTPARDSMHHEV